MILLEVDNLGKQYVKQVTRGVGWPTLRERLSGRGRGGRGREGREERFWALREVSFSLNKGDSLGVVGHNGAGKSTLFKIISRITTPTTGTVRLYGRVASLLEVGTGFHPELTGRENVFLSGAILGMKRAEIKEHFETIVNFAQMEDFIDEPVKHYSSGMYMRLAFAIAAHLTSEIMIVDEVLAVGDGAFQKKCLQKMRAISQDEGRAVLMVSHQLENVRRLCNKCLWLDRGRAVLFGETREVLARYEEELERGEK
jgi:lipopolysaccharide transport system ATP-binding protein